MSRWHSYLYSANTVLSLYKGGQPFASILKKYFSQHRKFGGQDRKWVSQLCYGYFRLGKALPGLPVEEKILLALFLVSTGPNGLLAELRPIWNNHVGESLEEKINLAQVPFSFPDIFPWKQELSEGMDHAAFCKSFLHQPDLFIRIRPGYEKKVKQKLADAQVKYEEISLDTLAFPNNTRIDDKVIIDKEVVVQDLSSQNVGNLLKPLEGKVETLWDCCAASGGKAIMAKDILGKIQITVSDIRASILSNLRKRFATAEINRYDSFVADLTADDFQQTRSFDLVIADVPCTGSGTWGRTPEQLFYFDESEIEAYASRQQKIMARASESVLAGGYLLYCTCSVFKKENELQVEAFVKHTGWSLEHMELIKGYDKKADTLFAALLRKHL